MSLGMNLLRWGISGVLLLGVLGLSIGTFQCTSVPHQSASTLDPLVAPSGPLSIPQEGGTSSVMVYIKVGMDKKYGVLAHVVGGKRDSIFQDPVYHVNNAWWDNPLIAYSDPPLLNADVIGRADAQPMIGLGTSANLTIRLKLVPHADIAVKTVPKTDGIKGTITTTLSASAEFFDGRWEGMAREDEKKVSFSFDTCDPLRKLEAIGSETRTVPAFALERYTRGQEKWEPKSNWPDKVESGDWHVVIYGRDATLNVTHYRYLDGPATGAKR